MSCADRSGIGSSISVFLLVAAAVFLGPAGCSCGDVPELPRFRANWDATVFVRIGGGHGTGVVVSHCGHILTNAHVAEAAGEDGQIQIVVNGSPALILDAAVVAVDERHDLAILRVRHTFDSVVMIETDDRTPFPGDGCYSIGYPLDMGKLASVGVVRTPRFDSNSPSAPPMSRDALLLDERQEPGTSGSGIYAIRDGRLIGLMSHILWTGQNPFTLLDSPVVVPARHIRPFLEANHVPYCRPSALGGLFD